MPIGIGLTGLTLMPTGQETAHATELGSGWHANIFKSWCVTNPTMPTANAPTPWTSMLQGRMAHLHTATSTNTGHQVWKEEGLTEVGIAVPPEGDSALAEVLGQTMERYGTTYSGGKGPGVIGLHDNYAEIYVNNIISQIEALRIMETRNEQNGGAVEQRLVENSRLLWARREAIQMRREHEAAEDDEAYQNRVQDAGGAGDPGPAGEGAAAEEAIGGLGRAYMVSDWSRQNLAAWEEKDPIEDLDLTGSGTGIGMTRGYGRLSDIFDDADEEDAAKRTRFAEFLEDFPVDLDEEERAIAGPPHGAQSFNNLDDGKPAEIKPQCMMMLNTNSNVNNPNQTPTCHAQICIAPDETRYRQRGNGEVSCCKASDQGEIGRYEINGESSLECTEELTITDNEGEQPTIKKAQTNAKRKYTLLSNSNQKQTVQQSYPEHKPEEATRDIYHLNNNDGTEFHQTTTSTTGRTNANNGCSKRNITTTRDDPYHRWLQSNQSMWDEVFREQRIEDRSISEAVKLMKQHGVWGNNLYDKAGTDIMHQARTQAVVNLIDGFVEMIPEVPTPAGWLGMVDDEAKAILTGITEVLNIFSELVSKTDKVNKDMLGRLQVLQEKGGPGIHAGNEGISPGAWSPSPEKVLQKRRMKGGPQPGKNLLRCTICKTNQHGWEDCPFNASPAYTDRDILHYALLHDISHPYRTELEKGEAYIGTCLGAQQQTRGGTQNAEIVCVDSGASSHFTSLAALTKYGVNIDPKQEPPIRSATGEAQVERMADITVRVFPINSGGVARAPIDIIQTMRLLKAMEKNLTLISAGTILAKLTEMYPGNGHQHSAPQINLKADTKGNWSRITFFDSKEGEYLHIPIKAKNGVYFMKCNFRHEDEELLPDRTKDQRPKERTLNHMSAVRMSRPVLRVTLTQLHYRLLHMSDAILLKFAAKYPEVVIMPGARGACETCMACLSKRESKSANTMPTRTTQRTEVTTTPREYAVMEELSVDPVPIPLSTGAGSKGVQWMWIFVCRRSRYVIVRFSKFKSAACLVLESVLIELRKLDLHVQRIKHDGGAEMGSSQWHDIMDAWGIQDVCALAYTPNHVRAERMIQFIKARMRVTLHSAKLPIATFWVNAARDVVHKSNLIPREALNWDTPWELVMGRPARVHRLRTFGSEAHVVRPADMKKSKTHTLGPLAAKCIVLENAVHRPGHHIFRTDGKPSSVTQDLAITDLSSTRTEPLKCLQDLGLISSHDKASGGKDARSVIPTYLRDMIEQGDSYDYGDMSSLGDKPWKQTPSCPIVLTQGMTIARQFVIDQEYTWFVGEITGAYTDATGIEQFVVEYEDDDREDLDADEFTNYLLIWGKAVTQRQKGVPPFPSHMYDAKPAHDRDTSDIAKNLINEIESMANHDDGIPEGLDQKVYDNDDDASDIDNNERESSSSEDNQGTPEADREQDETDDPEYNTELRRSTRTRKEKVIYDPSPAPKESAPDEPEGKVAEAQATDEEINKQVFFVQATAKDKYPEDEHDGVFTLNEDNTILEGVVRGAPSHNCFMASPGEPTSTHKAYSAKGVNYRQAMKGPHAKEYKAAADAEIAQLNNLDVFRYCSYEEMRRIDPLAKPILLGWVLVRKVCAISGKLIKTKGRIYRRGDLEEAEINYDPTKIHSSNVHLDAVKVLLAMAATQKLEIISMDVSGAFLRSRPTRLTFIKLPSGYKVFDKHNREMVAICTRALYGGKDCGRSWQNDRDSTILEQNWVRSLADGNMFRTVATISGGDRYSKRTDIAHDRYGQLTNTEQQEKELIPGETEEECLTRVKEYLENIETSYQKREDWLNAQETDEQKAVQEQRKKQQQWQNKSHNAYTASRSDDVQGNNGHIIPEGEEFPTLHQFDESQLCSNLPTNDTPGTMFANMAVFTDDMLIVTNNRKFGMILADGFMKVHPGKIDEKPDSFLGLGIEYGDNGEITISQRNLIKDMMTEGNMIKCAPAHTPITTPIDKEERPEDDSEAAKKVLNDIYPYMRVVGQAIWLRQSRPDLIYATSQWARVSSNPGLPHHAAIKRGVRYLAGTRNLGTTYGRYKYNNDEPYVICDANHDETCVSGMVAVYGGAVVAGRSWVQTGAQLHSFAAEKVALTDATKMACWIKDLVMDLGSPVKGGIVIYDDNQALIKCVKNENTSSKTRHLRIRMAWVKQMIKEGRVEVRYVNSQENISDALTKPLTRIPFVTCREQMVGNEPIAIRMRDLEERATEAKEKRNEEARMRHRESEGPGDWRCYTLQSEEGKHVNHLGRCHANKGKRKGRSSADIEDAWASWGDPKQPTAQHEHEGAREALAKKLNDMRLERGGGITKREAVRTKEKSGRRERRARDLLEKKRVKRFFNARKRDRDNKAAVREYSGTGQAE